MNPKNILSISLVIILFSFCSCSKKSAGNPEHNNTDSFTVSVSNGYGSGKYKVHDTVHIFSLALPDNKVFDSWSGDTTLLDAPREWHTWFIMPDKNVSFSGQATSIQSFSLKFETITGRDIDKPVYYYFPASTKGVVYLLHGTSGSADFLVKDFEWWQMIKSLVSHNFGVIITECEETTKNTDLNGDGKIRWNNIPWDTTTNVDFANLRIISAALQQRGYFSASVPKYAIGMSNGGNFAASVATIFNLKSGVSYCAPSGNAVAETTTSPLMFCMAENDNNPNVGTQGNQNAKENAATVSARGICSKYLINVAAPLYPERFARRGDISLQQSIAIFNEIKSNGFLDNRNFFKGWNEDLINAFKSHPENFPELSKLSLTAFGFVSAQISLSVADHHMYSDYINTTIRFLESECK